MCQKPWDQEGICKSLAAWRQNNHVPLPEVSINVVEYIEHYLDDGKLMEAQVPPAEITEDKYEEKNLKQDQKYQDKKGVSTLQISPQ